MARKEAQQVLLSSHTKERILALAIVRDEAQAEVARWLIDCALPQIERAHDGGLTELKMVLEGMKVDPLEALAEMAAVKVRPDGQKRRLTINDLKTTDGRAWRKTFPWPPDRRPIKA